MKAKKETFESYFEGIYKNRWKARKEALLQAEHQIIRATFDAPKAKSNDHIFNFPLYTKETKGIHFEKNETGLKQYYIMDPASVIAASSLEIAPDDHVLDMCAAPGGKSLVLLERLKTGVLWCNEISTARRIKLKSVIQEYVPKQMREQVFIKGKDGIKYGMMFPDHFDKILVDAPCSGEQHLLHSPKELEKWSLKRTKRLSAAQYALLCSALLALKPEGQILYSTCSISPLENDEVIKRLLERKGDTVELDLPEININGIERTKFGYIMLPDVCQAGPIYFSRLKKCIIALS